MRYRTLPVGRVGGTAVRLDPGLIFGLGWLFAWLFGRYQKIDQQLVELASIQPTLSAMQWTTVVVAGAVAGLVLHEAVHWLVTRLFGGQTRTLVLSIFGGGPEIVAPGRSAQVEWKSAIAGPIFSILLGIGIILTAGRFGLRTADVAIALGDLGRIHLLYGLANLLPVFPMDGGRAFRALYSRKVGLVAATHTTSIIGKGIAIACVVLAVYTRGIPFLFVALALWAGAVMEERHEWLASPIEGLAVRHAMVTTAPAGGLRDLVGEAVMALQRSGASALPIVADDGAAVGAVGIRDLRAVPPRKLWTTTLAELLPRAGGVVRENADLTTVRRVMTQASVHAVAVVDDKGALAGVLAASAIDRRISLDEIVCRSTEPVITDEEVEVDAKLDRLPAGVTLSTNPV